MLCPFGKVRAVGSHLRPGSSTAMGAWLDLQHQACVSSWGARL